MEFPDACGRRLDMMYPTDFSYWTKLKDFVDYEPVSAIDPELRGVLASIGIIRANRSTPPTGTESSSIVPCTTPLG
jgi:hypothetical protein